MVAWSRAAGTAAEEVFCHRASAVRAAERVTPRRSSRRCSSFRACVVRPETVRLARFDEISPDENRLDGIVEHIAYAGATTRYIVRIGETDTITADLPKSSFAIGNAVSAVWKTAETQILTT